jgi:hypothetical protein
MDPKKRYRMVLMTKLAGIFNSNFKVLFLLLSNPSAFILRHMFPLYDHPTIVERR